MNSKILIAFACGAVIASGIVYMAVQPEELARPVRMGAVQPKPVTGVPVAQEGAPPTPAVVPPPVAPKPAPGRSRVPAPVGEKPSPLRSVRSAVHREEPMIVAQNERPQEATPPTVPEPIKKQRPYDAKPADPAPLPAPVPDPVPPAVVTAPAAPTPAPQEEAPTLTASAAPEPRTPNTVTIQPGTILTVRIGESISVERNETGDGFLATLERPLVIDGFVIAERGARVEGRVTDAARAGRVSQSHLGVELVRLSTSDGQRIRLRTAPFEKQAASSPGGDLAKIGVGAAVGAAIGAAAGGGKGAAIGAGVGGAAGTADVLLTRGKPAEIPVETRINFRVQEPITITERLQ